MHTDIDLTQELAAIPADYQEIFRHAIAEELAENGQERTETDILTYLRRRLADFERGSFIRPDGRPGSVVLDPDAIYSQTLPKMVAETTEAADAQRERRVLLLKVGGFVLAIIVLIGMAIRGRNLRAAERVAAEVTTTATVVSAASAPSPTPNLPDITGADETLKTIGGLGGALTIGRPSSLELHYLASEETIALPIDPSRTTTKGELRFDETVMLSENPVAVWLFGTVLNYAIGIPDSMVRNLQQGDRVTINTDTGTALSFVVTVQTEAATHETGDLLSQSRTGLTLFALPALSNDAVAYAFARYDFTQEHTPNNVFFEVNDEIAFDNDSTLSVAEILFTHDATGALTAILTGTTTNEQPLLLSLLTGNSQTAVVSLSPADNGSWTTSFSVPDGAIGDTLFAELRTPSNNLYTVSLGDVPDLLALLAPSVIDARWDDTQDAAVLTVAVHNPTASNILLAADFIQLTQGGDLYDLTGQVTPMPLPSLLSAGETLSATLAFLPTTPSIQLQLGTNVWHVSGFPIFTTQTQP